MEVDRGRNCYTYRGFRYMAQHCRNQGRRKAADRRRLEYGEEGFEGNHKHLNNLKEEKDLKSLD